MKFNKGGGGNYERPKAGSYIGTCIRVIALGTQEGEYQGKKNIYPKVEIVWELSEKMKDGKPFVVKKKYTVSLADKAALRADLESWRGKAFTQDEIESFDEKKILGKSCILALVDSDDGKYTNVKSISPLMAGMSAPERVNPLVSFSLDEGEFDQKVFDSLSDYLKGQITNSPEWKALKGIQDEAVSGAATTDEEPPF